MTQFKTIAEYNQLSSEQFFQNIALDQQPIVIRNFISHWPLVNAAKQSNAALVDYLMQFYQGEKARMVVASPSANKRFFYNDDMTGVNYLTGEERVDLFLGRLLELVDKKVSPAIAMQNAQPTHILPGLLAQNTSHFFPKLEPSLSVGNQSIINTHYNGSDSMVCSVAGVHRLVLFPPEQTKNLYPGSLNFSPVGAPTSLANVAEPDFTQYPLFETALDNAYCAELNPGDAIFIPMLWWRHAESLSKVNGLIHYVWNGSTATSPSPADSLNLALLAMRNLSVEQLHAWRHMFDHYVFRHEVDPAAYIPKPHQQLLGKLTPEQSNMWKKHFAEMLEK